MLGAGFFLKGITFHNNKLYYTTGLTDLVYTTHPGIKYVYNIFCVDAATGKMAWGALNPRTKQGGGQSLGTFPVVYGDRAYIVTDSGLRVYNASTGALIGVDYSVYNSLGDSYNFLYNNYYVYHHQNPASYTLTAIKVD